MEEWILELDQSVHAHELGALKVARQRGWMPRIDLLESDRAVLIRAELAGVTARQIHLVLNQNRHSLTIRGHRPDGNAALEDRFHAHLLEIDEGAFSREIILPDGQYAFGKMSAGFKNGILTIAIPKQSVEEQIIVVEQITLKTL